MNSKRIFYATILFIFLMVTLILVCPACVFDKENHNKLRSFGIDDDESVFSFGAMTIAFSLLSFWTVSILELNYAN
jgi:hypothetical protein